MQGEDLIDHLRQYGDRTSSFMTTFPGFKSFHTSDPKMPGQIRFMETRHAWVGATEPLTPPEHKAPLFEEFETAAKKQRKAAILVPVAEVLSSLLVTQGYRRLQVGSEPIFELDEFFGRSRDPLERFPHARSLLRRGARVIEASLDEFPEERRNELEEMKQSWLQSRRTVPLHFLNQVDPWLHARERKLFLLDYQGKTLAFLSAVPIFRRGGFFYADYIRRADSKAGTVELLFIESMRALHRQGFQEVSLGVCPLADIDVAASGDLREKLALRGMRWLFEKGTFPLRFKSLHEFKAKLAPTRWEPLYLVAREPISFRSLRALLSVHFPQGILSAWLRDYVRPEARFRAAPKSLSEAVSRAKLSLSFGTLFLALHLGRSLNPQLQSFFEANGFSISNFTWGGLFFGPLFHNNHYHLSGDLLSFWAFGILIEIIAGSKLLFATMAAGLWLTNPLAWALLKAPLEHLSPTEFARMAAEVDYGSSNAVYAFAGLLGAWLRNPRWLIVPFALNGFFLCLARESWLSVHHLIGLFLGYAIGVFWLKKERHTRH